MFVGLIESIGGRVGDMTKGTGQTLGWLTATTTTTISLVVFVAAADALKIGKAHNGHIVVVLWSLSLNR